MELTTTPMMERQRKHRENSTQATQIANIAARFERLPLTSYQRGIFAIIATAWFVDSMDLGALTFVLGSIKQTFQLSTAEAGLLSSLSFLGMFVGAASAGLLADRFGRATVFQTSMIFWGLGSLACGVSSTVAMLGASRLLLGFGMGMEFPVAQSMVSEMIPAERRGRYIAYLEGFWPIGFIASGLLIYFVLSVAEWHWVFILQAIPALFVLVIRRYVPESPRWLASHGHSERAETVMGEIESKVAARLGGSQLPEAKPQPIAAPAHVGLTTLFSGVYARRTTMLWTLWFFALLGFYGLTTWLGALLQAKRFPGHQIGVLYHPDLACRHPGFPVLGLARRILGPQGYARAQPDRRRCSLLLLWRRHGPEPAHRRRPVYAVLPVRHVVGALRLYSGALSDGGAGNWNRLRLSSRPHRFADRPNGHRPDPAHGWPERRVCARRWCLRDRGAGGSDPGRRNQGADA
jgi:MFS family permease